MFAILIGALTVAAVVATSVWQSDSPATESPSLPASSIAATTTSTIARNEIEARLRDILRVRDLAYQRRDIELLRQIYTTDCPCLRGDVSAIRQLRKDNAFRFVLASTPSGKGLLLGFAAPIDEKTDDTK
jgi:hypothetical protein